MKKKLIILSLIAMFFGGQLFAQGMFGSSSEESEDESAPAFFSEGSSKVGPPINPGGPGQWEDGPVGEGLLILSVLAGGYALAKNRKSNKR